MPLAELLHTTKSPVSGEDKKAITGDVVIMEFVCERVSTNNPINAGVPVFTDSPVSPAPTIVLTDKDAARWLADIFRNLVQGSLSGVIRLTPDGNGVLYDRTTDGKSQPMATVLLDDADVMPLDSISSYLLPHVSDKNHGE